MDSHPLNLAHQQHRRAEAHLKYNRYDEAMQCHHNAAELLLDAMKSTTSSVALESITLQHSYHLKQKDLIKNKKEQYARVKKALDNIKLLSKDPELNIQDNNILKLQVAIYKNLKESESLFNILISSNESKEKEVDINKDDVDGTKIVPTQESVIEELKILNQNFNSMTEQMVLQSELLKDENTILKERVSYLEKERLKFLNIQSQDVSIDRNEFSALSMLTEGFSKEPSQTESTGLSNKPFNVSPFERVNQHPHFDLSALKDDNIG
ncbi:nuclear receptor-binding factor 2 [Danaus plexippus]|uniref:nuclear receptor-binding factor 2 n=1 Tax=Danaus plexippus TaxID=13037 RepID=UPI002AAFA6DD|nr:nuclear receptor-binding factor 2 [Danaus plexippus]